MKKNRIRAGILLLIMAAVLCSISACGKQEQPEIQLEEDKSQPEEDKVRLEEDKKQPEEDKVQPEEEEEEEEPQKTAGTYADTSAYVNLQELYQDYFILGTGCEAIDHWNNQKAEIGNPAKEALIRQMYGSITFGNEFKPAYNFNAASETIKITVISQNLEE